MRTARLTVTLLLSLLASHSLAAPASSAPTPSARKEAGERFQNAVKLYKEGDYSAALTEFRAAYQAAPAWEVLYNIGLTERRLFKYGQAVKTFTRYLEEGGKKVPADRRENVQSELEQISQLVATVQVKVADGAEAKVFIDGQEVTAPLSEPILIGPGPHAFRAEREGFVPDERTVEIVSRTKVEVSLAPKPKQNEAAPAEVSIDSNPRGAIITVDGTLSGTAPTRVMLPPGGHEVLADLDGHQTAKQEIVVVAGQKRSVVMNLELTPEPGSGRRARFPLAGVITAGAGALVLGAGGLFDALAAGNAATITKLARSGGTFDASAQATQAMGQRNETLAWVCFVTGSLALAAGAVITVVTLVSPAGEEESQAWLAPAPNGVTFGWSFK